MRHFLQKNNITIFIIILLGVAVGIAVWGTSPNSPSIIQGIGLNLVSSVFDIILTVLIIDKMIKRNEDIRWHQTKYIAYAKTTEIALEIQYHFSSEDERKKKPRIVRFGMATAKPDYRNHISNENFETTVSQYHNRIRGIIDLSSMLLEPEIQVHLYALEQDLEKVTNFFTKQEDSREFSNPFSAEIKKTKDIYIPMTEFRKTINVVNKLVSLMLEKST